MKKTVSYWKEEVKTVTFKRMVEGSDGAWNMVTCWHDSLICESCDSLICATWLTLVAMGLERASHMHDMSHSYVKYDLGQVVIRLVGQTGRHAVCYYCVLLYAVVCCCVLYCSHHYLHSYPRLLSQQTPFQVHIHMSESQIISPCVRIYIPLCVYTWAGATSRASWFLEERLREPGTR